MASPGRIFPLSENLTLPFDRRVWMELNALAGAGYEVSAICPMGEGGREPSGGRNGIHVRRSPALQAVRHPFRVRPPRPLPGALPVPLRRAARRLAAPPDAAVARAHAVRLR